MNNNFEINTNLALFDYVVMVNEIALEFFNEDGVYQPHIGKINAMRLFYNNCVTKSAYDEKYGHDIVDPMDMVDIVSDKDFIYAYNEAVNVGQHSESLNFGNAYKDAISIVDVKKSSFGNSVEIIGSMINRIADNISHVLTDENIEKVSKIAKGISEGKISAEAIVDAYAKHIEKQDETKHRAVAM